MIEIKSITKLRIRLNRETDRKGILRSVSCFHIEEK